MALFKICKGAETNLPQTLTNGYCYFCTDTTNFYIDYTDTYGALTRSKISAKYADKLRYTEDGNFVEIEPTDVLTKNNYETAIGVADTDKNGLMSSVDKTKLDGIADGAEVNVQPDWNQNDETADDYVKNRPFYEYEGLVPTEITTYDQAEYVRQQYRNGSLTKIVINGTEYTDFTYSAGTYAYTLSTSDNVYSMEIGSYKQVFTLRPSDSVWVAYVNETNIVSLDDKYIPDTIARITDLDGKMNYSNPSGTGSFSMGRNEDSTVGMRSHAEGGEITASGDYSHAEGYQTFATNSEVTGTQKYVRTYGFATHAEGDNTVAYGYVSHAEGQATKASGHISHAEGWASKASGDYSHAEGTHTIASGASSHSEGNNTQSLGGYSHAEGFYTIANSSSQHVQGKFNVEDSSAVYAHIVGNGENTTTRSNAHALDWNGNAYFAGNVYVNGTNADATGGQEVATKQYVDNIDLTMVVNVTVTDGVYTADKTSQEIASAVVNNKKNVVAVLCNGSEYNTLRCSYANLTDTTSQSVFIVWDHDSKTRAIMTISNDGTSDSITVSTDPFTMTIGIEQTKNEQGDTVYTSDYTADDIFDALSSHIVPVCMFENGNGLVFGALSNYNDSNGCFQFTSPDGSDCGVYYVNIYADGNVEVGKTSIPTYTEATTTESGLMSASDKIKLDGIAENADDNVQSDWNQDTDTDDSYIKNKPFKTLNGDDFSVVDNTLSLSTTKLDSIKTLGITGAQADQFIKVSSVDSNGNPTAYSAESLDDKYISTIGGTYDLTNNITFTKSNDTVSAADIHENRVINFIGQPVNISGTNYIYKSGITHAGFSTIRNKEDGTAPVASYLIPNIWQMFDDQIDGDHRKLYVRPYEIEFRRYDSGWKEFYIRAEKDRALIYNDQKLIDFNESRLTNLGTPTNDTDAATKKYVDDLVPVEVTTSASGLMSSTDKVKLDGVASNAASVTIKTWTVADMA